MDALISLNFILFSAVIIVWVVGVGLALSRWRRHPRVSLFALLAFALIFVSRFQAVLLPVILQNYNWTEIQAGSFFFDLVGLVNALSNVVAWAFVLCAIFGWRDGAQKQNIPPQSPSTFGNEPSAQNATL